MCTLTSDSNRVRGEMGLSVRCYPASKLPGRRVSSQPVPLSDILSSLSIDSQVFWLLFTHLMYVPHLSLIGVCGDVAMCQLPSALVLLYSGKTFNAFMMYVYVISKYVVHY